MTDKQNPDDLFKKAEELYVRGGDADSDQEMMRLLHAAAEMGHIDAQFKLGVCYCNGQGTQENPAEAKKWWLAAAEQGHMGAKSNLTIFAEDPELSAIMDETKEAMAGSVRKSVGGCLVSIVCMGASFMLLWKSVGWPWWGAMLAAWFIAGVAGQTVKLFSAR